MSSEEIALAEWAEREGARLSKFAAHWAELSLEDATRYPPLLTPGGWDDQYLAFSLVEDQLEGL